MNKLVDKILAELGLTPEEAKLYTQLSKNGPKTARELASIMKINRQKVYRYLKNLEKKGVISVSLQYPTLFVANPFNFFFEKAIESKLKDIQLLKENKQALLSSLQPAIEAENQTVPKFMVIEGNNNIYRKILQMISEAKTQLSGTTDVKNLIAADYFGLYDTLEKVPRKIKCRLLTRIQHNEKELLANFLKKNKKYKSIFSGRLCINDTMLIPRMVIKDDKEVIFFLTSVTKECAPLEAQIGFWTDSRALTAAFNCMFELLWQNSVSIS